MESLGFWMVGVGIVLGVVIGSFRMYMLMYHPAAYTAMTEQEYQSRMAWQKRKHDEAMAAKARTDMALGIAAKVFLGK